MGRQRKEPDTPDVRVRELMLKSAAQLFDRKGYAATTVREIVAAVGVSKPVLYYYFGNKEGIFLELMQGPFRKFDAVLQDCRRKGKNVEETLLYLYSRTFELFSKHIEAVRIMYSLYYGPPQGAPFIDFAAYHKKFWKTVRELIGEGIERGEFRKIDLNRATWAVVGPLTVATEVGLSHHEPLVTVSGLREVLKIVFEGLRAVPHKGEAC